MKFIHISDTHLIGDEQPSLYGIDPYFRLERALDSIERLHSDAKFIAITGDLCDSASKVAYSRLESIVKERKIDIFPILGNHDKRELFEIYFPEFIHEGFVQYTKTIDDKIFIFLDTSVKDRAYGELCDIRFEWLERELRKYSRDSVYIFMHHHPIDCDLHEMDSYANFKTSQEFWQLLNLYKSAKHISFGHIHRIMHAVKDGITLHSTRSTTFQVAYLPDSEIEYLTNEENPTYAVVNIDEFGDTRVHHHEYLDEDRLFLGFC